MLYGIKLHKRYDEKQTKKKKKKKNSQPCSTTFGVLN